MDSLNFDNGNNIIVGVLFDGQFDWYVTDKELWYLDYKKRIDAFRKKGYEIENFIDDTRKDLLVLSSNNAGQFLREIEKCKFTTNDLRQFLEESINSNDDSWKYDFQPSLYVDFDTQRLFSLYSEPASYEEYVPEKWEAKYIDFMKEIPYIKKYWINKCGTNLLEEGKV